MHDAKFNQSWHHNEAEGVVDCDELHLPGTSRQRQSEVDKLFMHLSCILYSTKAV